MGNLVNIQEETELAVIAHFLIAGTDKEKNIKIDALCELSEDLFLNEQNKQVIRIISKLLISGQDCDTINIYSAGAKHIIDFNGSKYLGSDITHIHQHISTLKQLKYKNDLVKTVKNNLGILERGSYFEDLEEAKNGLIADLSNINMSEKSKFIDIPAITSDIKSQLNGKNKIEGFSWGINSIDNFTSGIITPRLYVIGGLKKSGKSRFLIHTFKELYNQDIRSAFISMEMPEREVVKLLHSSMTGINDIKFRSGSFMRREEREIFENNIINPDLFGIECKSGLDIGQITTRVRRLAKLGFRVIGIDYIQRIKNKSANRANELEDISAAIADSCRINNVAILLLSQFNASAENPHEPPNMGSLKGSGGIGEAADTIMLLDNLYRRTKKDVDKNLMDIYFEQRYNDSGKIQIETDLGCCAFRDLAKPNSYPSTNESIAVTKWNQKEFEKEDLF
jgi:replicative DNA helicase